MPIMKYTPQFVERQYVPTQNIGLIDQVLGQRQKEYDMGMALQNEAMSQLYGLESTPGLESRRNQIVEDMQSKFQQEIDRRGGDVGAAAKSIASIIASAQKDPFFNLNRTALEESKYLQRMRAQNPNLLVFNDPSNVKWREGLTAQDFQYQVLDPEEIDKAALSVYGGLKDKVRSGLPVYDPNTGYAISTTTKGLTEKEVQDMLSNEQTYMDVLSRFPQLQDKLNDPNIIEPLKRRIANQVKGLVGGSSNNYLNPPANRVGRNTGSDDSDYLGPTFHPLSTDVNTKISGRVDKHTTQIKSLIQNGNVQEPSAADMKPKDPRYSRILGMEMDFKTDKALGFDRFNQYKQDYETLYNAVKRQGGTDEDFIDNVAAIEKSKGYIMETAARINNANFTTNFTRSLSNIPDDMLYEYENGKVKNKKVSYKNYSDDLKEKGLTISDVSAFVSPKGDILLPAGDGKHVAINKNLLSENSRYYTEVMDKMYNDFYNYTMKPSDIERVNQTKIPVGNNLSLVLQIDENNPMNRYFVMVTPNPENPEQYVIASEPTNNFSDIAKYFVPLISRDIDVTTFKPKVN